MQVRSVAARGLSGSLQGIFFPPEWLGLQAFQQPGLHLLRLQKPHLPLHATEVRSRGRWAQMQKVLIFFPKTKWGQPLTYPVASVRTN